jgi:DNA-binding transcriptional ArsR family regulator
MKELLEMAAALSEEPRVRLLAACRDEELCACQLSALLGLTPPETAKHLSVLRDAGLIEGREEGKWLYYRRIDGAARSTLVERTYALIDDGAAESDRLQADARELEQILEETPMELCRMS